MAKKPKKTKPTATVTLFYYEGKDKSGRTVRGEINGTNAQWVRAELRAQGIVPIKVRRKTIRFKFTRTRIKSADIAVYTRQMATMITAGIPLLQSIEIVSRSDDNAKLKTMLTRIKIDVEGGTPYSEALQKFPYYFDELYCHLVSAGELSGSLDAMLARVATYLEKTVSLKRKMKRALFYPVAVISVAVIVSAILLIFVVPEFRDLFKQFHAQLPAFTQFVLNLSDLATAYGIFILIGAGLAGMFFAKAKRKSKTLQDKVDKLILRLPIFGKLIQKAIVARYARTLSTTFAAGVPLVEALNAVSRATGNAVYRDAVTAIRDKVATGTQLNVAMRDAQLFPTMVVQMVAIGEESGALDSMLAKVANIFEEEVDLAIDGLSTLIEPIIIVILGVLVGGLVIAMYLPIFKLGSVM